MQEGIDQPVQITVGPPVHGAPVLASATPATEEHPETPDDAVKLEELRELVRDTSKLVEFIDIARERSRAFNRTVIDTAHPAAVTTWKQALAELQSLLGRPIQLTPGSPPLSLADAVDEFRQWVHAFQENAIGPSGETLHDDPVRLRKLLDRLESIDPAITLLLKDTRELLARHDLDPAYLERRAGLATAASDRTSERTQAVDALIGELSSSWWEQVETLKRRTMILRSSLSQQADARTITSAEIRERAQQGLRLIERLPINDFAEALNRVLDWAAHWRDDERFTAQTLNTRVQEDLAKPLQTLRTSISELEELYGTAAFEKLIAESTERAEAAKANAFTSLRQALDARYSALVELRREKLGRNPDERYFGAPAKAVNDAITEIAALEAALGDGNPTPNIEERAAAILQETEKFCAADEFEDYLENQWQHAFEPLRQDCASAAELRTTLDERRVDLATDPRTRPDILDAFDRATREFDDAVDRTKTFLDAATASGTGNIPDEQRALARAVRSAKALLEPARLEAELAAAEAKTKQEWNVERQSYEDRLTQLEHLAATFRRELESFQEYATSIESYAPMVAKTMYDSLVDTLNREAAATPALRLRDALIPATFSRIRSQLDVIGGSTAPVTIGQLEVALGNASSLYNLIQSLSQIEQQHPITSYETLADERPVLETLRATLVTRLQTVDKAIAQADKAETPGLALEAIRRAFDIASEPLPSRPKPRSRLTPALNESRRRATQELLFWEDAPQTALPTSSTPMEPTSTPAVNDTTSIPIRLG